MYPVDVRTDKSSAIDSAVDNDVEDKLGAAGVGLAATAGEGYEGGECLRAQRSATGHESTTRKGRKEGQAGHGARTIPPANKKSAVSASTARAMIPPMEDMKLPASPIMAATMQRMPAKTS